MKGSIAYMAFTGFFTVILVRSFFGVPVENDRDEAYYLISKLVAAAGPKPERLYLLPPLYLDLTNGLPYFLPGVLWWSGPPPTGPKVPGSYVFSYLKRNPADREEVEVLPAMHPRPFVTLQPQ